MISMESLAEKSTVVSRSTFSRTMRLLRRAVVSGAVACNGVVSGISFTESEARIESVTAVVSASILSPKAIGGFMTSSSSASRLKAMQSEGSNSRAMIYIIDVLNVVAESLYIVCTKLVKLRLISFKSTFFNIGESSKSLLIYGCKKWFLKASD